MTIDEPHRSAGWYSDPEAAGERWWNGSQWTSHTRADGAVSDLAALAGEPPIAWSADESPLATLPPEPFGTAVYPVASRAVMPAPPGPLAIPPGWYPDPQGLPAQRWWNGTGWTEYSAPAPGYGPPQFGRTAVVMLQPAKSVGVALLLTFFFGPLGMLYSTVSGALIMLGVLFIGGIFVGVLTLGLGWLVWWPMVWVASMIWGCLAAADQPTPVINNYR